MDKHTYKIREAVALGLSHYYLDSDKDRRKITDADIVKARIIILSTKGMDAKKKYNWQKL